MIDDLKQALENELLGRSIQEIRYYSITDNYFLFEEDHYGLMFGGVTLSFGDFEYSLLWSNEQLINQFVKGNAAHLLVKGHEEDPDPYEIAKDNFAFIDPLLNLKITKVDSEWDTYRLLDEFEEHSGEKRFGLQGLSLSFENGGLLHLATVKFDMGYHGAENLIYAYKGHLLISTNKEVFVQAKF